MPVSSDEFRKALSKFPSGVTVVTSASSAGDRIGLTVSAFSSLSLDPPLILVCLDHATKNLSDYTEGPGFCVNILACDQADISNAFGFPTESSPFDSCLYRDGLFGSAIIEGAVMSIECARHAVFAGGDHQILVGSVERVSGREGAAPLLYFNGEYAEVGNTA